MSAIQFLLVSRIKEHLTTHLITNVSASDRSRADIVKIGRFQDTPGMYVSISPGSQTDPELADGVVDMREIDRIGVRVPAYEIGGGQFWWRRGRIEIGCFLQKSGLEEEEAAQTAMELLDRLMYWLPQVRVGDLKDTYQEGAIKLFLFANTFFESGGPPKQYIWRGTVKWQCLTHRPQ